MSVTAESLVQPVSPQMWSQGNDFQLLENGEEYFPAVIAAIAAARREVLIETFILFEDAVGLDLQKALIAAARRGVRVDLTVDDYGSPNLSDGFIDQLTAAGVRLHVFDPRPRLFGLRLNMFRRLHRKIVSVDGRVAFVGGINFGADHLMSFGKMAKQDYAVRVLGPLAVDIHRFAQQQVGAFHRQQPWWRSGWADWYGGWPARLFGSRRLRHASGKAILVTRDNEVHRDDIERHYREAIRAAKREIVIANAYFFPGYRLLRQIKHAARRGVSVKLILQGNPDVPQAKAFATMLYPSLVRAGVEIFEYCARPLHAKVAVIDEEWATVGSSNLDPLSLALNLEANVIMRDVDFAKQLKGKLEPLLRDHCRRVGKTALRRGGLLLAIGNFIAYHGTRHFPTWAGWLPAHLPTLHSVHPKPRLLEIGKFARTFGTERDFSKN